MYAFSSPLSTRCFAAASPGAQARLSTQSRGSGACLQADLTQQSLKPQLSRPRGGRGGEGRGEEGRGEEGKGGLHRGRRVALGAAEGGAHRGDGAEGGAHRGDGAVASRVAASHHPTLALPPPVQLRR